MHNPKEVHLQVVYKILYHLKGTMRKKNYFQKNELLLKAYSDANYARSLVDKRSTFGYCTFLEQNLIT